MDEIQIVDTECETGDGSDNGTATGAVAENSDANPLPRLEEMFTFSSQSSDKKVTFEMQFVPTIKKAILDIQDVAFKSSKTCEGKG